MKAIGRYWGYLIFAALVVLWFGGTIAPWWLIGLSVLDIGYFLFQAPMWCCAVNRDGTLCRRNSSGLLLGCSLRQHKWQRIKMAVVPHAWRQLNRGLWASPWEGLATLGTLASVISCMAALTALAVR